MTAIAVTLAALFCLLSCASSTGGMEPAGSVVQPTSVLHPTGGLAWREYFPNVELTTHRGDQVRFYDDLIRGKVVVINFMYATCTES